MHKLKLRDLFCLIVMACLAVMVYSDVTALKETVEEQRRLIDLSNVADAN